MALASRGICADPAAATPTRVATRVAARAPVDSSARARRRSIAERTDTRPGELARDAAGVARAIKGFAFLSPVCFRRKRKSHWQPPEQTGTAGGPSLRGERVTPSLGQVSWLADHHPSAPSHRFSRQWLSISAGAEGRRIPRSQWRDRGGFAPPSLFCPCFQGPPRKSVVQSLAGPGGGATAARLQPDQRHLTRAFA